MYELSRDTLPALKISTRMIVEELIGRGCRVYGFLSTKALLQVILPDHPVPMRLYSVIGESMSFISGRSIAGNKQATNAIIGQLGVSVPAELYVENDSLEPMRQDIVRFIGQYKAVVAKPVDGAHGKGIFTGLTTYGQVVEASREIAGVSGFSGFLIQEQLQGIDIRVICIDGQYASAMTRVPATVVGDGKHTAARLVEMENQHPDRSGTNYSTIFNKINMEYVERHLSRDELQRVPAVGESVQVIGISNVGVGGTRKNLDEDIPAFMVEASEKIARELRLPVCGIDFFVSAIPRRESSEEELRPAVIEVNNCPGLTQYESFDDPRQKQLVKRLVDRQVAAHYQRYPTPL